MTISYNWLSEYLPSKIEPERLSKILTSIGLEVESLEKFESIKGGLKGLITAEIVECEKHPDADKLKVTKVNTGTEILQVVCGAPNAAAGQKVILAQPGTTIYPSDAEPITLRKAKIRGVESNGMICAEDEIGTGTSHEGIMVLPAETPIGQPAASLFSLYEDYIFEIGLTPNRMDAMSHLGVARDVCAWLSHHDKKGTQPVLPYKNGFKTNGQASAIKVVVENQKDCPRYAGISINNIAVAESPDWLKRRLQSIGIKTINNIVDITNFILHETGQPLHAFDADKITGNTIVVKNLPDATPFLALDDKERKLSATDLMICNSTHPMCIAGVYGGKESGVSAATKNIFLESAWFSPQSIRKTSLHHGLRTDAATRFEKGVDISNTVNVLKRAAELIIEICGGELAGDIIDIYPSPANPVSVGLKFHYLKKLSGKNYHGDAVKNILTSLGFEMIKEGQDELWMNVPFSKPDISIPADIVEEIMRIDGLDNIEIPATISIAPGNETVTESTILREKLANQLTGLGFNEIFTNSITNSAYYSDAILSSSVKMLNNLSADLDILRPGMLHTGLEVIAHNIHRKSADLLLFENGKTYGKDAAGVYSEQKHLSLYISGDAIQPAWNQKAAKADYYFLKGICERILQVAGISNANFETTTASHLETAAAIKVKNQTLGIMGKVADADLKIFGIKQPVFFADIYWDDLLEARRLKPFSYTEVSKYPAVQRDLALLLDSTTNYAQIRKAVNGLNIAQLQTVKLFDIFESDKLGVGKKSMAVNFTFMDSSKTLTDKEIDEWMNKIIAACEKQLGAAIRK
ncbi:MAG: phenylalanine--tRNA ligase subunit beta [Chitinophagaceae bacterium]|nr:MAG: phenylalanine--tRNA ligase subunit beta [Chitinophagaceae bacterium]